LPVSTIAICVKSRNAERWAALSRVRMRGSRKSGAQTEGSAGHCVSLPINAFCIHIDAIIETNLSFFKGMRRRIEKCRR
jgi:hypothetical protein